MNPVVGALSPYINYSTLVSEDILSMAKFSRMIQTFQRRSASLAQQIRGRDLSAKSLSVSISSCLIDVFTNTNQTKGPQLYPMDTSQTNFVWCCCTRGGTAAQIAADGAIRLQSIIQLTRSCTSQSPRDPTRHTSASRSTMNSEHKGCCLYNATPHRSSQWQKYKTKNGTFRPWLYK